MPQIDAKKLRKIYWDSGYSFGLKQGKVEAIKEFIAYLEMVREDISIKEFLLNLTFDDEEKSILHFNKNMIKK